MARYDYSLDVGQSIKTDEKIKKKEQEEACGCSMPRPEKEAMDLPVEEEQLENVPEQKPEKPELPEKKPETTKKVEIKPISFEKAKLISDFENQNKEKPAESKEEHEKNLKKETGQKEYAAEDEQTENPEEDEQDVNEFLEESFSKEAKECEEIQNQKNSKEEPIKKKPHKKKWLATAAIIIIAMLASAFGYIYFSTIQTEDTNMQEIQNITKIVQENTTKEPAIHANASAGKTKQQENTTAEDILTGFTDALKDK